MFTRSRSRAKQPALVVTDETTGHTNIVYIPNRSTKEVGRALDKCIQFLNKHGIDIGIIKSDREGAFIELGGSKYRFQYTSGPGTHDAVSESVINVLKRTFICKREGLSFSLPRSLYPKLMEHVCVLYNHQLKRHATATPAEMVSGTKISADDLIQGAFGRIALFKIPDEEAKKRKLDDLDPKTEYGIVVGFEPSNPRNLKVYLPVHQQIVTRRGGKEVGNPDPIIKVMNQIAAEEEAAFKATSIAPHAQSNTQEGEEEVGVALTVGCYTDVEKSDLPSPTISSILSSPLTTKRVIFDDTDSHEYFVPAKAFDRISLRKALGYMLKKLINEAVIQELVTNMGDHNVWTYIKPEQARGKHILPSHLFLKIKETPNGQFDKLKARLVGNGSTQNETEYNRTSSSTVDFTSLALVLSLSKYLGAKIATVDVPAAYLNAELKETIYMRLDKDIAAILCQHDPSLQQYRDRDETIVVLLNKCLYGLKQSGAEWFDVITTFLISIGYTQSVADRCVFYKQTANGKVDILTIHVDDLLFVYTNQADFEIIKKFFIDRFGDMNFVEGNTHNYLGMSLEVLSDNSIFLSQSGYSTGIVNHYHQWRQSQLKASIFKLKPYKTPSVNSLLELKPDENCNDTTFKDNIIHFVYCLMYLAQKTRPDLLFTATFFTTLVLNPPQDIVGHLDRAYGYLSSNVHRGLVFGADSAGLTVFADAAYAIHRDGKSHTGVIIQLDKSPILVKSIKQKLVTLSSTEAEIEGLVSGLKCLQPIKRLLDEFKLLDGKPTKVKQDNRSAITIVKSGEGYTGKSKHMRVRYHAIAEQIQNGEIDISHCPTLQMLSDMLTKPGGGSNFADLVDAIVSKV